MSDDMLRRLVAYEFRKIHSYPMTITGFEQALNKVSNINEKRGNNMNNGNYNYESPITRIQNQLLEEMVKEEEDQFMCEVRQTIGYNIDKSELIKALNYDRDSYERGYQDGRSAGYRQAEKEKRKGYWFDVGSLSCRCSECGCKNNKESNYCPECGAYMKGENNDKTNL